MTAPMSTEIQHDELLLRVGHLTRLLHNSLSALGLDKLLEHAAEAIPDARDRLDYVARMSEQSAQRVLNATDLAIPLQEAMINQSRSLQASIEELLSGADVGSDEHKAQRTTEVLQLSLSCARQVSANSADTKAHLIDIMMAQDFQDLTGQVIKKVTDIAQTLETQLVQLLLDYSPPDHKREVIETKGLLNGPQIHPEGHADLVSNQGQVDDLLDSLGF